MSHPKTSDTPTNQQVVPQARVPQRCPKGEQLVPDSFFHDLDELEIPEEMPVFPLKDLVVVPMAVAPILVGHAPTLKLVESLQSEMQLVAFVNQKSHLERSAEPEDLHRVGCAGIIHQSLRAPDGSYRVVVQGLERIRLGEMLQKEPWMVAKVQRFPDVADSGIESDALLRVLRSLFEQLLALSPGMPEELMGLLRSIDDPRQAAYLVLSSAPFSSEIRQELLETDPLSEKLRRLVYYLQRELSLRQLEKKLTSDTQEQLSQSQKEYFLREHLKTIQKELGESDESDPVTVLREEIAKLELPQQTRQEVDRELARLQHIPAASPEYGMVQTYLEWIASLPWGRYSGQPIEVPSARRVLDEDHYDLKEVKDRILEHLAVKKLREERATEGEARRQAKARNAEPPDNAESQIGASENRDAQGGETQKGATNSRSGQQKSPKEVRVDDAGSEAGSREELKKSQSSEDSAEHSPEESQNTLPAANISDPSLHDPGSASISSTLAGSPFSDSASKQEDRGASDAAREDAERASESNGSKDSEDSRTSGNPISSGDLRASDLRASGDQKTSGDPQTHKVPRASEDPKTSGDPSASQSSNARSDSESSDGTRASHGSNTPKRPKHKSSPAPPSPHLSESREPLLCFVGPPGVGKTSLGQSIARAMDRPFVRISLGGVHDEAEIRGHRRTYIGAMPGRIIQALRRSESADPVFMLDEIDKLGMGFHGDPSAALLEVLDPAQNKSFVDTYLGVEFDLSQVLFICTANTTDTIPPPLLDRMEVINLAGYTVDEKLHIALRYLLPKQERAQGLRPGEVELEKEMIRRIVREYTREAGVRNLERAIAAVLRKSARQITEGKPTPIKIDLDKLHNFLGPQKFFDEMAERMDRPGVATGLAWTPAGGELLFVEAALMPGQRERLLLTGMLGDVMRESATAALSWLRSHGEDVGIDGEVFSGKVVHIHVPAGAIPKDGPSAGVTIAAALASLASDRVLRSDVAMTGELTLRGKILPVGGIKEKALAAHRAGVKHMLLPRRSAGQLEEVPEEVKKDLDFELVDSIEELIPRVLQPDSRGEEARENSQESPREEARREARQEARREARRENRREERRRGESEKTERKIEREKPQPDPQPPPTMH